MATIASLPPVVGLGSVVDSIYTQSLKIVGLAVFLMFIYAGLQYLNPYAGADAGKKARQAITDAIIGAVLLFSAYVILNTLNRDLVGRGPSVNQNSGSPLE